MIGIKYETLRDPAFISALEKIAKYSKPEPTLIKKLYKVYKAVSEESKVLAKLHQSLLEEYAERDDKGAYKTHETNKSAVMIRPTAVSDWEEANKKIGLTEASLDCEQITFAEAVNKLSLTPAELVALDPLIAH